MGEWLSNNVLLPTMYLLIDIGIAFVVLLLAMYLLEMILDNKIETRLIQQPTITNQAQIILNHRYLL